MTAQNAANPPDGKKEPSSLIGFFANPLVGLIGTLASIIGVLLAVFFYVQSTKFHELVYYVNPAQAIVVKTGEASRLRVLVGDRELKSDVTTAQIAIWNRGNQSLRPGDVLAPILIRTSPSVPILEVTLRKKSRDVVDISLDQKHLDDGIVGISFNILEQGDGGVIQLIYAGNPDKTRVTVGGVIESQREIRQLQYSGTIRSISQQVHEQHNNVYGGWFFLGMSLLQLMLAVHLMRKKGFKEARGVFGTVLLMLGVAIFWFLQSRVPEPPFGF